MIQGGISMNAEDKTGARVALGCYAMTGAYGEVDRNLAIATIHRYVEHGKAVIDTADLYGDGENERLVAAALDGRRQNVLLCSKFGFIYGKTMDERKLDGRPERVEAACDASLTRLKTDSIDLYYLHRVDPEVPIEDTVGAMSRLVEKGKIRAIGLCEVGRKTFDRAYGVHPISAVQTEYSLWSREAEDDFVHFRGKGCAVYGYSPLGRGFLSGQIRKPEDFPAGDQRRDLPRFQGKNFEANLKLVDLLRHTADLMGVSAAQVAIAWCARNALTTPVVGATRPEHIDEALAAVEMRISESTMAELERIFHAGEIAGERYSESAMNRLKAAL